MSKENFKKGNRNISLNTHFNFIFKSIIYIAFTYLLNHKRTLSLIHFRFNSLENEVRKRDEIISQLQKRIQELERLGLSGTDPSLPPATEDLPEATEIGEACAASQTISKNGSSGSDDASGTEEGFMVN